MSDRRPSNHPDEELKRVRGVLHSLLEHPVAGHHAAEALHRVPIGPTFYAYLYAVADYHNPFNRKDFKWKKRCMMIAYSREPKSSPPELVQRCRLAAMFYLLAEGLYSMPRLPDLT